MFAQNDLRKYTTARAGKEIVILVYASYASKVIFAVPRTYTHKLVIVLSEVIEEGHIAGAVGYGRVNVIIEYKPPPSPVHGYQSSVQH